jgi:AraC-like DNA-binding protein
MNKKERLNLILLNAARKDHPADWNWKGVNSPFARIYMVESGSARVLMPDGTYLIHPGKLYLIPSFVTHSYENDCFFTLYYIHVYDDLNIFDRWMFPFEVDACDLDAGLVKRLIEINPGRELKHSDPVSYDNMPTLMKNIAGSDHFTFHSIVETRGILLQLFSRFLRKASPREDIKDKRILKIMRFIRENINRNILLGELSATCGLTNDHLIRLFRRELNCTPMQYVNLKKIEKAQLMLIIGEKSIKDIACDLSFYNSSYFFRLFKKITGATPNDYRDDVMSK